MEGVSRTERSALIGASGSSPGSQGKMGLGTSVEAEGVARPLLEAGGSGGLDQGGDSRTGEKTGGFGGSLFPPWCLDPPGAWGGLQSHAQCPGLAWVHCQPFLEMGNRSDESLGAWVCLGDLRTPGLQDRGAEWMWLSLVAPRPTSASGPSGPAPQLSGSCHRYQRLPRSGPNKGKTKIHFPLSESGEGEWG